jgi:repressor LexA
MIFMLTSVHLFSIYADTSTVLEFSMQCLTEKQKAILDFIRQSMREAGCVPTVREIAAHFGFKSVNAAQDHLAALERKGYIDRRPGLARGIELAPDLREPEAGIPIVGRVAAGQPLTAIENLDGYLELGALYGGGSHYALRVHGDSMIDAGIWDGDFAIVREQETIENGEIGVAIIEGEATVKRIRRETGFADLIPANDRYERRRIDLATTDFRIGGKVVGVHRVL